jgi:hypothetical protein
MNLPGLSALPSRNVGKKTAYEEQLITICSGIGSGRAQWLRMSFIEATANTKWVLWVLLYRLFWALGRSSHFCRGKVNWERRAGQLVRIRCRKLFMFRHHCFASR